MITLNSIFSEAAKKAIVDFLNDNGICFYGNHFIGGSNRFGYQNGNSDLDIFCYSEMNESPIRFLMKNYGGFYEMVPYTSFMGGSLGFKSDKWNTHVIIIKDVNYYNHVSHQHDEIEKFLNEHPIVRDTIRQTKSCLPKLKGKTIYKILLNLARTIESKH